MKATRGGGVERSACFAKLNLTVFDHNANQWIGKHLAGFVLITLIKRGKKTKQKFKKTNAPVLRPTAGRGLVEHLCKHKTSSSALSGLQRNVSSEQALNQLCLALRGTLCWSHVGLSLIAHDRVATSQFFFFFFKLGAQNLQDCRVKLLHDNSWATPHVYYMHWMHMQHYYTKAADWESTSRSYK